MSLFMHFVPDQEKIKADFAAWAEVNLRVRKPTGSEVIWSDTGKKEGSAVYNSCVPLLKDASPALYQSVLQHFNKLTELHCKHQDSLWMPNLAKRQAAIMQSLYDELKSHTSEIPAEYGFNPVEMWRSIYVLAVDRYYDASKHTHKVVRPQRDIQVQ